MGSPTLTVIIPAYNEAEYLGETLEELYEHLDSLKLIDGFELIVSDNGSIDYTFKIVSDFSRFHPNVLYVKSRQKGFGRALKNGISKSKGEFITFLPADGEVDLSFIGNALEGMGDSDFICGSRFTGSSEGGSGFRSTLSFIYAWMVRGIIGHGLTEIGTIKMFPGDWARKINDQCGELGWGWQTEILFHAISSGLRLSEIPVRVRVKRPVGESKVNVLTDGLDFFKSTVKYGIKLKFSR